uniref:Translation initiation factor IF-2 n=1 Tax=Haemonchus contortus TaxID=6289 RepID=A0A7I5E9W5_HAECO
MDYLLFAFALIGTTLACQPVPKPSAGVSHGHDTADVTIVTNQVYESSKVNEYMGYFPKTKIQEYSAPLGVFSNLGNTDSNGYFAFTFTLTQCNCDQVRTWVNQIVASSNYYTSGNVVCNPGGPVIIEAPPAPPATTTTAAPANPNKNFVILGGQNGQNGGQVGQVRQLAPYGQVAQVAPVGQVSPVVIPQYVSAPAPIVVGQQPVIAEPPVIAQQPVIAAQPVIAQQPVLAQQPVIAQRQVVAEQQTVYEEPY